MARFTTKILYLHQGKPALVMPYYDSNAEDLLDEEYGNGMPAELVLRIAVPVATALAELHARSLVHCDLKPANVLLNGNGKNDPLRDVVLADFGLASSFLTAISSSSSGGPDVGAGTLHYMSPEQHALIFGDITGKSDVWALGCTMVHLLSGRRPFWREPPARIRDALVTHRRPPALPGNLSQELSGLIADLLDIILAERPEAAAVAAQLSLMLQVCFASGSKQTAAPLQSDS